MSDPKTTAANFAVRCSKLDTCGWGWLPSLASSEAAKEFVTPGTERFKQGCASCGSAMEIVSPGEFFARLPARHERKN